jgi:hypothetical protein
VRGVLDAHPGPLIVRAPAHGEVPLAPGYVALELPPLGETERARVWRDLLDARDHDPASAEKLAARFAVGPGAMIRACAELEGTLRSPAAAEHVLATALRQHRSARIEAIATRVETLARWDELVVPDDIADALREVCARVRHRRLVLEGWGMERAAARPGRDRAAGGGPGTGKTMAAGVIAWRSATSCGGSICRRWCRSGSARPRRTSPRGSTPPRKARSCCCSTRPTRCSPSAPP